MKLRCKKCGDIIEGDKKGTYITCKCKAIAIDETPYYWRIIGNAENFEEIQYIKRGRVNSENFYCKRVDNLYGKSKDVINTHIKLNNVKMNEDNTGSIFDDLK